MRVLLTMGTRPEIIKLGPVYRALLKAGVQTDVFWTGQHIELAAGLLDLFEIQVTHSADDIVHVSTVAGKLGRMAEHTDAVLRKMRYDIVMVQGDTTTAMAAASAAFMHRVPVAHVEAGLRTGNLYSPWPEEFNRRVITLATAYHYSPTKLATANLIAEGIPANQVYTVGNTVIDALLYTREKLGAAYQPINNEIRDLLNDKKLILATLHRRENIGSRMCNVLNAIKTLAHDGDKLFVLPVHANPEVRAQVKLALGDAPNVLLVAPLQYPDFVYLLSKAWIVMSDSGGVQEEAPTFGLHVLITRDTTERPEVVDAGFGMLVGSDYERIVMTARTLTHDDQPQRHAGANPFGSGDAGKRIAASLCHHERTEHMMEMQA